jgi:hypothetical protein
MPDASSLTELDNRIAALRENIRELTEQAAALSGAANENLASDRISEYETRLAALLKERDSYSR